MPELGSSGGESLYKSLLNIKRVNRRAATSSTEIKTKNAFSDLSQNLNSTLPPALTRGVNNSQSSTETVISDNDRQINDMFDRYSFEGFDAEGVQENNRSFSRQYKRNRIVINRKNKVVNEVVSPTGATPVVYANTIRQLELNEKNRFKMPDISTIVRFLSENPATKISYNDFLYCKKLGAYPNNRLIILRRFYDSIDDSLIDSDNANVKQYPLSVMVTWFNEFPLDIKFKEDFTTVSDGLISVLADTASDLLPNTKSNKFTSFITESSKNVISGIAGNKDIGNPWLKSAWYSFLSSLYKNNNIPSNFENVYPETNPNLIREAIIKTGLSSTISATITFEYQMRYVNGIDPHMAMHNILANIIRMGSSTSVSTFPKGTNFLPEFVKDINEGEIFKALTSIYSSLSSYLSNVTSGGVDFDSTVDALNRALDGEVNSNANTGSFTQKLFSLYRFQLQAALSADLGRPSGYWHLTIGNPFNPIASVGDLYLNDSIDISFNNELSYDDFPTEVSATIKLTSARNRGAQEIEQIFNAGRGRIYVYPSEEDNPDLYLGKVNPTMGPNTTAAKVNPTKI